MMAKPRFNIPQLLLTAAVLVLASVACNAIQSVSDQPAEGEPTEAQSTASPTALPPTATPAPPTATPTMVPPTPVIDVPTEFRDEGRTAYLQSDQVRVGVDTRWGGAIREIWYQGQNLINNYDGGRLLAVSLYDSEQPATTDHPNDTGWNPTPSDMHDHANPPLEISFEDNALYTKSRYLQWFPNDKGGGPGSPVPSEIVVESWIRFFTDPQMLQLRYRITNESEQGHAVHRQEFPFAYVRAPFNRYVTYAEQEPWTEGEVFAFNIPMTMPSARVFPSTEGWASLVNEEDIGLTMWAPQSYPNHTYAHFRNLGPTENNSLYLLPKSYLAIGPKASLETQVFLYLGDWRQARKQIGNLRQHFTFPDVMFPYGHLDSPEAGQSLSGEVTIDGWAIDNRGLDRVEVHVDGEIMGEADYGHPRPDVEELNPALPGAPDYGLRFALDTNQLSNGTHQLRLVAVDQADHRSILRPGAIEITISN